MAGVFNPSASGGEWTGKAPRRWRRLMAAIAPWMVASAVVTATMDAELAPRADQTTLPEMQPPPPPVQPGHSDGDDVYFDPLELIAV